RLDDEYQRLVNEYKRLDDEYQRLVNEYKRLDDGDQSFFPVPCSLSLLITTNNLQQIQDGLIELT
ncbi:hypothetical protein B4U84_04425, partial [Westiellopsis prolifica IICB1]